MWCASDLTDHQEEQRWRDEEGRAWAAQSMGRGLRFVLREKKNHTGEIQARDTWPLLGGWASEGQGWLLGKQEMLTEVQRRGGARSGGGENERAGG